MGFMKLSIPTLIICKSLNIIHRRVAKLFSGILFVGIVCYT